MSTIGTGFTLADIAKRLGGDQPILVDGLTNANAGVTMGRLPMRQITGWVEQFNRIVGRPTVSWRRLGAYVASSKGNRTPHSEGVFVCSGVSEVDKLKADRDPRGALVFRAEEDWSFLEALGNAMSLQLYYGGTSLAAATESFEGLCVRCASGYSTYVTAGGSLGCSVYAFSFGPGRFMGIYNVGPSGKIIEANDYGAQLDKDVSASSDSQNEMYKTFFNATLGIAQYHPLSIARIPAVNPAASDAITAKIFTNLYAAMERKPDLLATTWTGWGAISELLSGKQSYPPGVTDYAPYVGSYDGIPIIVDSALMNDIGM